MSSLILALPTGRQVAQRLDANDAFVEVVEILPEEVQRSVLLDVSREDFEATEAA